MQLPGNSLLVRAVSANRNRFEPGSQAWEARILTTRLQLHRNLFNKLILKCFHERSIVLEEGEG